MGIELVRFGDDTNAHARDEHRARARDPHVNERASERKRAHEGGEPKREQDLLVPGSDRRHIEQFRQAIPRLLRAHLVVHDCTVQLVDFVQPAEGHAPAAAQEMRLRRLLLLVKDRAHDHARDVNIACSCRRAACRRITEILQRVLSSDCVAVLALRRARRAEI